MFQEPCTDQELCAKRLLTEQEIRKPDPVLLNFIASRVSRYMEDRQTTVRVNHLWD